MGFLFRLLASLFLAIAIIVSVIDAARSIAASALALTSLADAVLAAGLEIETSLLAFGETSGIASIWTPITVALLSAPAILVFIALALIFYAIGYRRRRDPRHMLHA